MFITRRKAVFRPGQRFGVSLLSDFHIGSAEADERAIKADLERAVDAGDRIAINGDVFDAIVSGDPRYTPSTAAKWLAGRNDALNAAVDRAAALLGPYAGSIDMIGAGNHESAVEKHRSVDLTRLLVDRLNGLGGRVNYGGYTGFISYEFSPLHRTGREGTGYRYVVYYHHGSGKGTTPGGAVQQFDRLHTFVDADLLWLGHKHFKLAGPVMRRLGCPRSGNVLRDREVHAVMSGSYLDTYRVQSQKHVRRHGRQESYASDAALRPQGKGGARVTWELGSRGISNVEVHT